MECEFHDSYSMNTSGCIDIYSNDQVMTNIHLEVMPELPLQLFGYVWDRLDDGNGIGMATVSVFTASNEFVEKTDTDQTGFFSFSNLKEDTYRLTACKEGYQAARFVTVHLEPDSQMIQNIVLPPLGSPENLIYGHVTDSGKKALADVRIDILGCDGKQIVTTLTSHDGAYAVYGLPDGAYRLICNNKGYASQHYEIKLGAQSRLRDVDIALIPVETPSKAAAVCGFITNKQGIPLASAWVGLYEVSPQGREKLVASATANADGFYIFSPISAGKYQVKAKARVM